MRPHLGPLAALALFLLPTPALSAAVFQVAVSVETRRGPRQAFLWIPPEAQKVRGLVVGGMTLAERELARDPLIRQACREEGLGIVFLTCGLGGTDLQVALDRLARESGFEEIATAPVLFFGHSAGGPQALRRASEMASRCFGLVQYRGGGPGREPPLPPGIPALMICGQFDEFGKIGRDERGVENWEKDRDEMVAYRRGHPGHLGSFLVEPGAGHFAWSERCARYLARFIASAARARIPAGDSPLPLKTIDPAGGWLTDPSIRPPGPHAPAPFSDYTGDRAVAFWHLDRELAEASVAFREGMEREDQFITWKDPFRVQAGARKFLTRVSWVDAGHTFEVEPVHADHYPEPVQGRGSRWGRAGQAVDHAPVPIRVRPVSGPLVSAGPHRLRVRHDALTPATSMRRVTFLAWSPGDARFRPTECVGMLEGKLLLSRVGQEQTITFATPPDIRADRSTPLLLEAESDANLVVEFHVGRGPAVIEGRELRLAELPPRLRLPAEIEIVAYQRGSFRDPRVKTATPVTRVIRVLPPAPRD